MQIIEFLDKYNGALMVIITLIYAVLTGLVFWANHRSAKASTEQLQEMQKQYADSNRPLIELEFHYIRRTWYVARFVNHGKLNAQHVKINLDQSFVDSLPEESFRRELNRIKGKECIIGAEQRYDLFIGSNELRGNPNMRPLTGTIEYEAQGQVYKSDLFVDLEHYITFFSATTDEEEILKTIKGINSELKGIKQALSADQKDMSNALNGIDNDLKDVKQILSVDQDDMRKSLQGINRELKGIEQSISATAQKERRGTIKMR